MRDKKRINLMLNEIAELWENNCPDWRFGQLISNIFDNNDLFFIDDDTFMEVVKNFFNKNKK